MVKKEVWFCVTLIIIGTLDLLTTIVGVVVFGANETNPLIAGLAQSNILLFSAVKLAAITVTGLVFYKAEAKAKITSQLSPFTKKFLNSGYAICLFALSFAVLNNFSAIINVA